MNFCSTLKANLNPAVFGDEQISFRDVDLTMCEDAVDDLTAYVAGATRIGKSGTQERNEQRDTQKVSAVRWVVAATRLR
jgi:hypothetical protein